MSLEGIGKGSKISDLYHIKPKFKVLKAKAAKNSSSWLKAKVGFNRLKKCNPF
jgi:hypothetical protein